MRKAVLDERSQSMKILALRVQGFDSHTRTRLAWLMNVRACYCDICKACPRCNGHPIQRRSPNGHCHHSRSTKHKQADIPCFKRVTRYPLIAPAATLSQFKSSSISHVQLIQIHHRAVVALACRASYLQRNEYHAGFRVLRPGAQQQTASNMQRRNSGAAMDSL